MSRLEDALNKAYRTTADQEPVPLVPTLPTPSREQKGAAHLKPIYNNIRLTLADVERPLVAITSALPREGVSTILFNLAKLVGMQKRTLVVDFNILRPRLHKLFQVDNIKGLSDILQGKKRLEECISETEAPNVNVLPCGPTSTGTFQILGSDVVRKALADLRARYEIVFLDCPCLRDFPDSAILASLCDGVALVVRAGRTKREVIQYSQELLEKAGARELGVVLNRVRFYIPELIYRRL